MPSLPLTLPIPIVFINLDKDTQRRERMQEQLARLGLQGQRLPAVWWRDLPAQQQAQWYSPQRNRAQYYKALVDGEKGCYASHIVAWQQLLASDAPALVVLEDDVLLQDDFAHVVQAVMALPTAWDMVKLMGRAQREKVRSWRALTAQHRLIQYRRVPSFTAGYIVSRAGAQKLLQSRVPFGRPIDIDLRFWWENQVHILGIQPPVVRLDVTSQDSSIAGRRQGQGWITGWRKFAMKARLTWENAHHVRQQKKL